MSLGYLWWNGEMMATCLICGIGEVGKDLLFGNLMYKLYSQS